MVTNPEAIADSIKKIPNKILDPGGLEDAFPAPLLAKGTLCMSTQQVTGPMRELLPEGSKIMSVTISPIWSDIPY